MRSLKHLSKQIHALTIAVTSLSLFLFALNTIVSATDDKGIIERISYEFFHISIVEVIRIALSYVVWPLIVLVILCLMSRLSWCKDKIEALASLIDAWIIKIGFNEIFRKKKRKELNEHYIKNALTTARAQHQEEKLNAITQLSQYTEVSAFDGLIKLLAKEKDVDYQYAIINALSNIVKKRRRNNH